MEPKLATGFCTWDQMQTSAICHWQSDQYHILGKMGLVLLGFAEHFGNGDPVTQPVTRFWHSGVNARLLNRLHVYGNTP